VKSVLERTLGVSIFQEQGMQLAVAAGGLAPPLPGFIDPQPGSRPEAPPE
jgi:hypothetical protein